MKPEIIDAPAVLPGGEHAAATRLGFELPDSKFHPPAARPGIVRRTALIDRLAAARAPVISVVAPPGYGKTTLMAQWAQRVGPRVAWVSCDDGDNDPVVLLSALAIALNRIEPLDQTIFRALASSGAGITVVPRFVSAITSMHLPVTVVLDHAEAVTNKNCLNVIGEFALRLPRGWQFALASRTGVPLPTARLRAQGGIIEIGAEDLAMGPPEASALLKGAGAELGQASIHDLLQRTEGWPAGLYIAALAMKSGTRHSQAGFTLTGDDVFMGDYLRSELLDRVSTAEASFLIRTSVLDRMSGPLCDAILGEKGSGRLLERMEDRNLLVIPLDRRREWYRYHQLLRELLQSELRRLEPELAQDLHFRAAAWFEANAMPEAAIDHAKAAGDYDRVARLLLDLAQPVWASGRVETVLRWMEWLRDITSAEHYGAIAVHGSLIFALLGQPGESERWTAAAERASPTGILPDGSTMEGTLAYLRAILCRDGIDAMRRDAQIAWDGLSPASPYGATMLYTVGNSYLVEGDPARAEPGEHLPGTVLPRPRRPAEAPADLRAARRVSPGAARDGALLHHARRPRWRRHGPDASPRHPPAKAGSRHPPETCQSAAVQAGHDQGQRCRRVVADGCRVAASAATGHPPFVPGDWRAAFRFVSHGQDAGVLCLPETRRLVTQRRGRPHARTRPGRALRIR